MNDPDCRPAIASPLPDTAAYDIVFVGFPVWWYVEPRVIDTFLQGCDLASKTIVPFATSGGSGISGAERRMAELVPAAEVKRGKLVRGDCSDWAISAVRG